MIRKSLFILILFLSLMNTKMESQSSLKSELFFKYWGSLSPQTSSFMKFGVLPASLYSGQINYEVPIYEIKDKDFDIPISIIYTSDGFQPYKRSSVVGYNCFLNVGGVITREVYGTPDDLIYKYYEGIGLWWASQIKNLDKDKLFNFTITDPPLTSGGSGEHTYYTILVPSPSEYAGLDYDAQPDLFFLILGGIKDNS